VCFVYLLHSEHADHIRHVNCFIMRGTGVFNGQRLYDKREAKLRSLTASISQSHAEAAAPVRRTKLAYVNSAAKPPRDVLRRQMKNRSIQMQQHPAAVNGKRTAAGSLLTGKTASSPKKRHSEPPSFLPPSHAESSTPQKGASYHSTRCMFL